MSKQQNSGYRLEYMEKFYEKQPQPGKKKEPEKPPPKRHGCVRVFIWMVQLGLIGLLLGVVAFIAGYIYLSNQLSDAIAQVENFRGTGLGGTPRFYDRNGNLLFELHTTEKRRWLAYSEIPPNVIDATIAVEDDTFWTNPGFDPAAIVAALVNNYRNPDGRPVGASTITQQLVRHIAFTYEERVGTSYERKLREIFLAFIMTQRRSKEAIIQMYLNEIYYGNLAYGIEAAAQTYFGKSAVDLSLGEAAFLAGLPQSPVDWDPYTNYVGAKERQEMILDLMLEDGNIDYITAEVAKGAPFKLHPLITVVDQVENTVLEAPHFVLYAQQELEQRYGPDALTRGGWQIITSLDLNIHSMAEQVAREQVAARAAINDVSNASVVILKPSTGEILAMVGSLDYFNEAIDGQVNVALSPRQPGSSIKPITFASAMERGWTTADVLWDVPIELEIGDNEKMHPRNYDGYFHGPVLFRDALANSYNIPPIQILRDIGVPTMIATARTMGIESLDQGANYYGLAVTLGGGEVKLLEMAQAYATFANYGERPRLTSILRITDSRGNVVYDVQQERLPPLKAIDPRIAFVISDILDDDQARIPAMGRDNSLDLPFPAAAKTGTTNDFRDNWTMGYTPGVVVGVWLGNADGHPMRDSSGLQTAAPVWNRIMTNIHANPEMMQSLMVDGRLPATDFIPPPGIEARLVCLPQGTGGSQCTATRQDWFLAGSPTHGIGRIGYNTYNDRNPGAWTLNTLPLPAAEAQKVTRQELEDGTVPPLPTLCVVNSSRAYEGVSTRLFLPIPPYYPDEVEARLWAQRNGYNHMAPPSVCPISLTSSLQVSESGSSGSDLSDSAGSGSVLQQSIPLEYNITAPTSGQKLSGNVPIIGTVLFDPAQVAYYQLEISSNLAPETWTLIGTSHTEAVRAGLLEQLNTEGLPPGDYVVRLLLVGPDGGTAVTPYSVPVTIGP
ncbi:MAG: transglycosylase domain-containing protein [Ardenticatenaceae bacterium]|nr:transglycosylase domain-containing protein [Ardenticatenaceae bacterium]